MTPLEELKAARTLLSDPLRWTKSESARDLAGRRVSAGALDAVCWCAEGALQKFTGWDLMRSVAYSLLVGACSRATVWSFNDLPSTSHADVLALYDDAIAGMGAP